MIIYPSNVLQHKPIILYGFSSWADPTATSWNVQWVPTTDSFVLPLLASPPHTHMFCCLSSSLTRSLPLTHSLTRHAERVTNSDWSLAPSLTHSPPWPTTNHFKWTPPPTRKTTTATSSTTTTASRRPPPLPSLSTLRIPPRASAARISRSRRSTFSQSSLSSSSSSSSQSPISTNSSQQPLPSDSIPSPIEWRNPNCAPSTS